MRRHAIEPAVFIMTPGMLKIICLESIQQLVPLILFDLEAERHFFLEVLLGIFESILL